MAEATQQHGHAQPAVQPGGRPKEDWFSDEFVTYWIDQQEDRARERHRQFVRIRAILPKEAGQEFRYVNLGAGPGHLDELLLEHFRGAQATLLDGSPAMLDAARQRLKRFEGRVEFVEGNLATPEWVGAVQGPFDVAISSIALHNLREPSRLRQLYGEVHGVTGDGGMFVNLDYVRIGHPSLIPLAAWAAQDPEAEFTSARGGGNLPGTVEEQLGWMREAGFGMAACFWKEFQVALMVGVRDGLRDVPDPRSRTP